MEKGKIKVQKGRTIKEIPVDYKKDYINAGWREYTGTTTTFSGNPRTMGVGNSK